MAKVTFGHDGKIITYGGVLPRVCCNSNTNIPHTPTCRNNPNRIDKVVARRFWQKKK
jgi:hypothetical protein